ncbi:MAG: pyridoxal-phosphate dependent enzyme [Acidimicrobiales bacterium]
MKQLGLEDDVVDPSVLAQTIARFRERGIVLPTFQQLANPETIPSPLRSALARVDPDEPHPSNLFRVHWHNSSSRVGSIAVPEHVVLGPELTGVEAKIVVALADRFPLIAAHKVLASYGCLAPRVITGQFDPTHHRAIWPSTGNYCRGGVAISRLMGCRGVAVLPAGMSRERFAWLDSWVQDPGDVVRTPGSESNVKEIYDECNRLAADPANVVFNQFSEFGNHLVHYLVTGRALEAIFAALLESSGGKLSLRAFVSATGSAGTIGAGDYLKERFGASIVAVEALECPTMLYNGFGEHNIQGIGDKHIPLIHNVMNTDYVTAVSDHATDALNAVFNSEAGRTYLATRQGVPEGTLRMLGSFGLSSICNVLASIKLARHARLGPDDVVLTVATDGAAMYASERDAYLARHYHGGLDEHEAGLLVGEHLHGVEDDHFRELDQLERERIFNLGYFTWVEQQGVTVEEFTRRRAPSFWHGIRSLLDRWDELIVDFNARAGSPAA